MSLPQAPQPAKLLIGGFLREKALFDELTDKLSAQFGPTDLVSSWWEFNYTEYYVQEMGSPLFRRMLSFRDLIEQDQLAAIKLKTNELEKVYTRGTARRVNLDPGYLLHERFVLATGKNFTHRIYIGHGIYADLTLIYQQGGFRTLPWTYPDYAAEEMRAFLMRVRGLYSEDIKRKMTRQPLTGNLERK